MKSVVKSIVKKIKNVSNRILIKYYYNIILKIGLFDIDSKMVRCNELLSDRKKIIIEIG